MEKFFKLAELAKKWGKTEDELLHLAAAGEIVLSIYYDNFITSSVDPTKTTVTQEHLNGPQSTYFGDVRGYPHGLKVRDFVNVRKSDLMLLYTSGKKKIISSTFNTQDGRETLGGDAEISLSTLLVMDGEISKYETEHPEIIDTARQGNLPGQSLPSDDAMWIVGMVSIKEFFKPHSWNTIKNWLEEHGYSDPAKGQKWRVLVTDALAIRSKKSSFIDKKKKNKK